MEVESVCESCSYWDNPIGHCCDSGYKVVRDKRGKILSRRIPQIICKKLKDAMPSEWRKDSKKEASLSDGPARSISAVHKIKYYVNPEEEKQEKNYKQFEKIAKKKVSPKEEAAIINRLNADYWDEITGISRRLEAGWKTPVIFKNEIFKVYQRVLSAWEAGQQENFLAAVQEEKQTADQFVEAIEPLLTPKQYQVFKNEYTGDVKKVELAQALGCSKPNITKLKNKAQKTLQRQLGG